MQKVRVELDSDIPLARENPVINKQELLISLGRISAIRLDTICFIKSGAMKGPKAGTVTIACHEQLETAEALLSSVVGDDSGILEPGFYSKERVLMVNE